MQANRQSRSPLIVVIIIATLITWALLFGGCAANYVDVPDSKSDRLIYAIDNFEEPPSVFSFRLVENVSTPMMINVESTRFDLSPTGQIAFALTAGSHIELFVQPINGDDRTPLNISRSPDTDDYALAWSLDGKYLAFESYSDWQDKRIFIWDGKAALDVTPDNLPSPVVWYYVTWSPDQRLTFSASFVGNYTPTSSPYPNEIYLWDGNTTRNLSQNPLGDDLYPTWSSDGRLAFLSERESNAYEILIWDGSSLKHGSPDSSSFDSLPHELTAYYSLPTWTNDDRLVFGASSSDDEFVQIYLWDGETATNISQNPDFHNGSETWSTDGQWAFATFFSSKQLLYVRDTNNRTVLTVEGQHSPAWSLDNMLAFCGRDSDGWHLSVWDGQKVIEVTHAYEIIAQWQGSGAGVICSDG